MTRICFQVCSAVMLAVLIACGPQPAPDTRAADEQAIRDTEAQWSRDTAANKDVERFLTYYTEDASVLAPNSPIATGKEAIRATLKPLFGSPGFSLSFQTAKVEVARSGDLAYTHGTYTMTLSDAKGNPVNDRGKYVTVYKKQADGKWKSVADMFNSDLPMPAPAAK